MTDDAQKGTEDTPDADDSSPTSAAAQPKTWGRPFVPGKSGNPQGRPPGPNRATRDIRALCYRLLNDPEYLEILQLRLRAGMVPPAVEVMLYAYAYGKPKRTLHITTDLGQAARRFQEMTSAELAQRAEEIAQRIRERDAELEEAKRQLDAAVAKRQLLLPAPSKGGSG